MKNSYIYEYEQILLGKRKTFSAFLFGISEEEDTKHALEVCRYGLEKILNWQPTMTRDYFDTDIAKRLKLLPAIEHIAFPPELNPEKDYFYIIHRLYPQLVHFDTRQARMHLYEALGQKGSGKKHFPKGYFQGPHGPARAADCLLYVLKNYCTYDSIEDLYSFFGNPSKANQFLKQYQLYLPCNNLYEYPVDFLHASLGSKYRINFLHEYYHFINVMNDLQKKEKKERRILEDHATIHDG